MRGQTRKASKRELPLISAAGRCPFHLIGVPDLAKWRQKDVALHPASQRRNDGIDGARHALESARSKKDSDMSTPSSDPAGRIQPDDKAPKSMSDADDHDRDQGDKEGEDEGGAPTEGDYSGLKENQKPVD
jgi:hypothetical protein